MAGVTPSTGSTINLADFEDDEPYRGILRKPKDGWFSQGSAEYGGEDRLTIDWELEDGQTVRDWISLRLGKQKNGTVSKLRMLLNALAEKPRDTEVTHFENATPPPTPGWQPLEWGYGDPATPFLRISEGMEVIFRGVKGQKQDGTGKFTIQKYASAKAKAKPVAKVGAKTAVIDVDPDEVPF